MAATVWKGYITFGLISIPVRLHAAARTERVSFNQIHKVCGSRIKQQIFCPVCDRVVERSELGKGFPVAPDEYVMVEDADLKKLLPESSESMEILEFVALKEVDPIYFDSSYYAVPEEAGRKAYQLLMRAMERSGMVALARVTMHQREFTIVLRPREHGLTMHTIFYPEEVREVEGYGGQSDIEVKPAEVALAEQLVQSLTTSFEPGKYHDEYQGQLRALIEAKRQGHEAEAAPKKKLAPVIDLMEALQKSLAKAQDTSDAPRMPAQATEEAEEPKVAAGGGRKRKKA